MPLRKNSTRPLVWTTLRRSRRRAVNAASLLAVVGVVASCDAQAPGVVGAGSQGAPAAKTCGSIPESGCPCTGEGQRSDCGKVLVTYESQHLCGDGTMVCQGGRWGECIISNTVHIKSRVSIQGLSAPTACVNPCTENCENFPDTPAGIDAGPSMVVTDAGLTLAPNTPLSTPPACTGGAAGSCAHSICSAGGALAAGCDPCVASVCAISPSCCTIGWTGTCIATMKATCSRDCAADGSGACVVCYKDAVDHDGDGYSFAQGDCLDCDPQVNPGAYDFPNGIDDNCNGTIDEAAPTCDTGLALASGVANDYARAMELCQFTTSTATGAARTWGVLTDGANAAKLTQADGTTAPNARSYGILPDFGPANVARKGANMAVFSSGTARRPTDPSWVNPSGQYGSYNAGTGVPYPPGFPKNKAGCGTAGTTAFDSSGITMKIRVPTNAQSFSFNLHFFSSEYPEWVCDSYNDSFVALLTGLVPQNPANSKNISFDAVNNPINVNAGFFSVPGGPVLTSPILTGTGYDGICPRAGNFALPATCGGSTNWLMTTAPVVPGETITMQFGIWDTGDHVWDSAVLLDNWAWSPKAATITTLPDPPKVPAFGEAVFTRDYDVTGRCPTGTVPHWDFWSWDALTPSDSRIEFSVQSATDTSSIGSAQLVPLLFSNPPGPSALTGQPAIAATSPVDTQVGSTLVDWTLRMKSVQPYLPVVRITIRLVPSTDKLFAPTLKSWDLAYSCTAAE